MVNRPVLYQVITREPNYILWCDAKMTIFPHAISGCAGGAELDRNEWALKCHFHGLNRCFLPHFGAKSRFPAPASNRNCILFVPNVKRSLTAYRDLRDLSDRGLLIRQGKGRGTYYTLAERKVFEGI